VNATVVVCRGGVPVIQFEWWNGATSQLTICPHQNNAGGVSSLSITVYTDRQLTSALGTGVKCVCVDAIASWLTRPLEQGWARLEWINNARALNNKHDKGPAQIESLGSNSTAAITKNNRRRGREVKLKVAVRQPPRKNPWMLGYASHSNHHPLSVSPPSKSWLSASEWQIILGVSTCQCRAAPIKPLRQMRHSGRFKSKPPWPHATVRSARAKGWLRCSSAGGHVNDFEVNASESKKNVNKKKI
jgi:hypothetical protein